MNQLSKRLREAVDTVSAMPLEQQDLLASELLDRAGDLSAPALRLSQAGRASLLNELEGARRGEFASDEDVAAMYRKHGL